MQFRKTIRLVSFIIAVPLFLYLIGFALFKTPKPFDIIHHYSGTQVNITEPTVYKIADKFALYEDSLLFLPPSRERVDVNWDSSYSYYVTFRGFNNLTEPIILNSIWFLDTKSLTITRGCALYRKVEGRTPFSFSDDLNGSAGNIVANHRSHQRHPKADSLADFEFRNHFVGFTLFTSVGKFTVTQMRYISD